MGASEARIRANRKWNEKNLDRIGVTVKKGEKAPIVAHAKDMGESTNAFIVRAIRETMERDRESVAES